jgi:diguanylate cyclase (GGDEF)-like protein
LLAPPIGLERGMRRYGSVTARQAPLEDQMQLDLPGIGARWLRQQTVPLADGLILTLTDVTEHKRAEEKLRYMATHDALTDLPNRTVLHERLRQTIDAAGDCGSLTGLLFLDLDNFKTINDAHGHHIGDQVLTRVATRLKRCIGEQDMVSRPGGDEFIVIAGGLKGGATLAGLAREIIEAFARPLQIGAREFGITCSIGIALCPTDSADAHTLLRYADTAMYEAKGAGKNTFRFFTADMNARVLRRVAIEEALRGALQRDELSLLYQPQVDVGSGRVVGAEALIRWKHAELGWVPPDQFISVAEETGFISAIGQWVIDAVCAQCRAWRDAGYELPRVAINLSARQLDDRLPYIIRAALARAELDAANLELELTESYLMHDVDRNIHTLAELGAMGLHIAIDDFGTGYSSLSYLKRLPVDAVKIDKSFVRDLAEDSEGAQVMAAIITLAHNLNLRCVAEGVESEPELRLLRAMGCDEFQGYLHSKPVPAQELAQRYLTRRVATRV